MQNHSEFYLHNKVIRMFTRTGARCLPWSRFPAETDSIRVTPDVSKIDNVCRNPDLSPSPWCYISQSGHREPCEIERTGNFIHFLSMKLKEIT